MSRPTRTRMLALVLSAAACLIAGPLALDAAPGGGNQRGNIDGTTVRTDGSALGNVTVQLYANSGGNYDWVAETISDADGSFSFRRIQAGSYTLSGALLTVPPTESCSGSAPVSVVARQTANVTLTLTCQ